MKSVQAIVILVCCLSVRLTTGLDVTLADLQANGYVMNPESGNPPSVDLVCSYTLATGDRAVDYVTFFKDGEAPANQLLVFSVADGIDERFGSFVNRNDVTVTSSGTSVTVSMSTLTLADEGRYRCRVSLKFNAAVVTTTAQTLVLLYRPNPPQISLSPQTVAQDTYRVTCSSSGGRPAPTIKWFTLRNSDNVEVAVNESSSTITPQGDTFLVESVVDVMATDADPVQVICQLLHDSLTSQTKTQVTIPESAAPSTTTTMKPTNETDKGDGNTGASTGGLDGGAVAGIVIAVLIIVAIIVGVAVFVIRRKGAAPKQPKEEQTGAENPAASQTDVHGGNENPAYPDTRDVESQDEKPPIQEYKPEPTTV